MRETLNILLEGTPRGVSLQQIRSGMEAVEGVVNVHDLHVWCLGSYSRALACHVTIADIPPSESACILASLNGRAPRVNSRSATPPFSSSTSAAKHSTIAFASLLPRRWPQGTSIITVTRIRKAFRTAGRFRCVPNQLRDEF